MTDLRVKLGDIELDNPIIPASGTFGYGQEFARLYDINCLGAVALKGTTVEPRYGNPLPRVAECTSGVLNAVGLQNPGIDAVIHEEIPNLLKIYHKPIIANISGYSVDEFVKLAEIMDKVKEISIIEANLGCPNIHKDGLAFGSDEKNVEEVTSAMKKVTSKPVYIKLSPNVTDIVSIAKTGVDAGADGICLINTVLGMRIDVKTKKPVMARKLGGLSGPAIFPIAVRMIYQVASAVDVPIIGMGGIKDGENVLEMIMAGASAVQVGAENLVNPFTCKQIIESLPGRMERLGIKSLEEIKGCALEK